MATFSGGEEIVGAFSLTTANNSTALNYTVPAGKYAKYNAWIDTPAPNASLKVGAITIGAKSNQPITGGFLVSYAPINSTGIASNPSPYFAFSGETVSITLPGGGNGYKRLEILEFNNP